MSDRTVAVDAEVASLLKAAAYFWPNDSAAALQMARQGVLESVRRPASRQALLEALDDLVSLHGDK
jgi:hypothetical protein